MTQEQQDLAAIRVLQRQDERRILARRWRPQRPVAGLVPVQSVYGRTYYVKAVSLARCALQLPIHKPSGPFVMRRDPRGGICGAWPIHIENILRIGAPA